MKHYLTDRGVQAAISAGVVIAAMAVITDDYRTAYVVLSVLWAGSSVMALVFAHRKRSH